MAFFILTNNLINYLVLNIKRKKLYKVPTYNIRLLKKFFKLQKLLFNYTIITFDDNVQNMNKNNILNTIKQQIVSGVRFEASGRLTRRLTAMRSVFKYRYVGSLKNIRSSFNNKSSIMLRGNVKSNSQYTI